MGDLILHVVGARPNFMKAAPVIVALERRSCNQLLVHTGQHYDRLMSSVFFEQLSLPEPDIDLGVGSGSHAIQTAEMMESLERVFIENRPSIVVVYGDVNSTVAAALVAIKLGIAVAHVEAGLRSFDMSMPEEVNRRVTDQLSELLFVTSVEGIGHLANEGLDIQRMHFVGNPMIDTLRSNEERFDPVAIQQRLGVKGPYAVATVHRPSNVDEAADAAAMVGALNELSGYLPLVIPLHPRGRETLQKAGLHPSSSLHVIEPLGYLEFVSLVHGASVVVTDSGGIQEETTVLGVPCLTVRENTERPVTITHGTNELVRPDEIATRAREIVDHQGPSGRDINVPPLWDGVSGDRIAEVVHHWLIMR